MKLLDNKHVFQFLAAWSAFLFLLALLVYLVAMRLAEFCEEEDHKQLAMVASTQFTEAVAWGDETVAEATQTDDAEAETGQEAMWQTWTASWYEYGSVTASGEPFNPDGLTAAHKTMPFGTRLEVCYQSCVVVRVNDRGPFVAGRDIDLSRETARRIGMLEEGVASVAVRILAD